MALGGQSIYEKQEYMKRRSFLTASLLTTAGIGLGGIGADFYAHDVEPRWYDITHIRMRLPGLTPAFHGYTFTQISDLHTDETFMTPDRVSEIVTTVNNVHSDLIIFTGDFVTFLLPSSAAALAPLSKLKAPDGVLGIYGNHDGWMGWIDEVRKMVRANSIHELINDIYTLRRGSEMLHFVGMEDLWPTNEGTPASVWSHQTLLQQLTARLPAAGAAVLLVHEPDFADVAATEARYGLQISGHSHGGQVNIPFHGPFRTPPLSRKYPSGMYHIKHLTLYTNRGLGMVQPQIRFNCRPEITVFTLSL